MSQEERERVRKGREITEPLAERLEEGTVKHEPVTVWFRDGKEHTVEVYALSSGQFRKACRKANMNMRDMQEIGEEVKLTKTMSGPKSDQAWDFFQAIADAAVKEPANIIDEWLLPNEEAKIATKVLQMSQPPKPDSTPSSKPPKPQPS